MALRVVAGSAGGRHLKTPKGHDLRPTQDRIKQAMFSSLGERVPEARVLDLYAGTGALGIEALSRGATTALFVEKHRSACRTITENLALCRLETVGRVVERDVIDYLAKTPPTPHDLIFADPPYDKVPGDSALHPIFSLVRPWLADDGLLIWEFFSGQDLIAPEGWTIRLHRTYGETAVAILSPKLC